MATREELYTKFGIAAEAGQLFETELGTLLLCPRGLEYGWHLLPNGEKARAVLDEIDRSTLRRLANSFKGAIRIDDDLADRFSFAQRARNRLNYGFYEKHNFKIQTDEGRQAMIADLEAIQEGLFQTWQFASAMTSQISEIILHDAVLSP
ncbi:hypothetical protein E2A64_13395 [Pseudohoeflea suaedae]|uniref:Uncharacterized protein n=1 Tax=Pseudohoeflea suaedae TaxID=877384 RepID=A0A4V3A752_9HYPH|nr:hypothetical protein [Pseudohoeflea suaedae]TDH36272.1 hypothetical protein E2A64_13395 [Pseudohoeflea suaedae]